MFSLSQGPVTIILSSRDKHSSTKAVSSNDEARLRQDEATAIKAAKKEEYLKKVEAKNQARLQLKGHGSLIGSESVVEGE